MAELVKKKVRPKHLNLITIRLPLPGIMSILHRVSGVGLFLLLPFLIYLLHLSLYSPETFVRFQEIMSSPFAKIILFGLLWAYMHHFCMGIRILLIDMGIGVELKKARGSAWAVLLVSLVFTLALGAKLIW